MQTLFKKLPKHWSLTGTNHERYDVGVDSDNKHGGKPILLIQSTDAGSEDYAYCYQLTHCTEWLGQRLRVRASFKTKAVEGHAVICIYVKTQSGNIIVYDAMIDQSLKGDNDWQRLETVFDVPEECRFLYFGPALWGRGMIWVADFAVEKVSTDVARTDIHGNVALLAPAPVNLNFSEGLPPSAICSYFESARGWKYDSSSSSLYNFELVPNTLDGKPALTICSKMDLEPVIDDGSSNIGYVCQIFSAVPYRGKKIKFSARIKTENCNDRCGLVLMVQGPFHANIAIATISNDSVSGTSDWQEIRRVLHVPQTAYSIYIFLQLNGGGKGYFGDVKVAEAAADELVTDKGPGLNNLDFTETE